MLSVGFALIIGGSLGFLLYDTGDKKPTYAANTYLESVSDKREDKLHNLNRKYDNMSEQELNEKLKDLLMYNDYKNYSRQFKIDKLVGIMMER